MFYRNSTNAAFKYFLLCLLEIQPMFEWNINLLCSVGFAWLGPRCLREDTEELQKSYSSKRSRWKGDNHKHGNWSWAIRLEAQRDAGHVRCLYHARQWHGTIWARVEQDFLWSWILRLQNNTSLRCSIHNLSCSLDWFVLREKYCSLAEKVRLIS